MVNVVAFVGDRVRVASDRLLEHAKHPCEAPQILEPPGWCRVCRLTSEELWHACPQPYPGGGVCCQYRRPGLGLADARPLRSLIPERGSERLHAARQPCPRCPRLSGPWHCRSPRPLPASSFISAGCLFSTGALLPRGRSLSAGRLPSAHWPLSAVSWRRLLLPVRLPSLPAPALLLPLASGLRQPPGLPASVSAARLYRRVLRVIRRARPSIRSTRSCSAERRPLRHIGPERQRPGWRRGVIVTAKLFRHSAPIAQIVSQIGAVGRSSAVTVRSKDEIA